MSVRNKLLTKYALSILQDQPIRCYPGDLDINSNLRDIGLQRQPGMVGTGLTFGQTGLITNDPQTSMYVGSGSGITIPTAGLPSGSTNFVVECVFKFSSLPASYAYFFELGTRAANQAFILELDNNAHLNASMYGQMPAVQSGSPSTGVTIHLAARSVSGDSMYLYINGAQAGIAGSNTPNTTLGTAYIGNSSAGGVSLLAYMQYLTIYNYDIGPSRIAAHYLSMT